MRCELVKLENTTALKLYSENNDDQRLLEEARNVNLSDGKSLFYVIEQELEHRDGIASASIMFYIKLPT